jgi:hypothetical protein
MRNIFRNRNKTGRKIADCGEEEDALSYQVINLFFLKQAVR